jgi:hypothetical protein
MPGTSRRPSSPMLRCTIAALILALLAPPLALTQDAPTLVPGATVRAKTNGTGGNWIRGELVAMTTDTVFIREAGGDRTVALPTGTLTQLQVSRGIGTRTGKGALLGLGVGAGTGLLLGVATSLEGCEGFCQDVEPGQILVVAVLLGGVGAGIGALIGSTSRGERWQRLEPSPKALRIQPGAGGIQVGLSLKF